MYTVSLMSWRYFEGFHPDQRDLVFASVFADECFSDARDLMKQSNLEEVVITYQQKISDNVKGVFDYLLPDMEEAADEVRFELGDMVTLTTLFAAEGGGFMNNALTTCHPIIYEQPRIMLGGDTPEDALRLFFDIDSDIEITSGEKLFDVYNLTEFFSYCIHDGMAMQLFDEHPRRKLVN